MSQMYGDIRGCLGTGVRRSEPASGEGHAAGVEQSPEAKGRTNPRLSAVGSAKADGDASLQTPIQLQREEIGAAKRPGPKGTTASPS
jgi:hypothetical protein